MGLRDSCGPGHPEGLQKGEIRNMNSLVGKSTGIALLMAAALLAALFAMGVFSATGVGAHEGDHCESATSGELGGTDTCPATHSDAHIGVIQDASIALSNELPGERRVTMTITFRAPVGYSTVAGTENAGAIVITSNSESGYSLDEVVDNEDVMVNQGGNARIAHTAAAGVITVTGYNANDLITVTIPDRLNNPIVPTDLSPDDPDDDPVLNALAIKQQSRGATDADPDVDVENVDAVVVSATISPTDLSAKISSTTPGAPVRIDVSAFAENLISRGEDITVELKDFGVPSSIPESSILITGTVGTLSNPTPYLGPPEVVTVSGKKITMSLASRYQGGADAGSIGAPSRYTITFKQSAGITNPTTRGNKGIEVADLDPVDGYTTVNIKSKITLSSDFGARGMPVTVTGKGLGTGGATAFLVVGLCADKGTYSSGNDCTEADDITLGHGTTVDGVVNIDIDTSSTDFVHGVTQVDEDGGAIGNRRPYIRTDKLRGRNEITIVDGAGTTADVTAYFGIIPTIATDEDSAQQGDELTILVEDWDYNGIREVRIGDEFARFAPDTTRGVSADGSAEFEVIVPTRARLGEQQLKVIGNSSNREGSLTDGNYDAAKGTVVIGALDIEVEPATVVLGQQFTVKVNGFSTDEPPADDPRTRPNENNEIQLVAVGDVDLEVTTGGESIGALTIDTNGDFTNTFVVKSTGDNPDQLKPGTYRVEVRDHSGRVALGKITFPEPEIDIDPPVGRRGTTVTLSGSNFPAGRVVHIYYKENIDENLLGAVLADSAGNIRMTFTVPSDAEIGEEQDIIAESAANRIHYKAKTTHSLPDQELIVTPEQASAGGRLTIEGHNMPLFTLVQLNIANINVSGRGVETDGLGSFVIENVLVPQLKPGSHTVEAEVQTQGEDDAIVRKVIQIVDIITRPSEEAFADLIENGTLTRVWHLDRQTQTWSFFDPAPEFADFNTLGEVSSGQIVTIIMSATDDFQGTTLYPGSNPISIE